MERNLKFERSFNIWKDQCLLNKRHITKKKRKQDTATYAEKFVLKSVNLKHNWSASVKSTTQIFIHGFICLKGTANGLHCFKLPLNLEILFNHLSLPAKSISHLRSKNRNKVIPHVYWSYKVYSIPLWK